MNRKCVNQPKELPRGAQTVGTVFALKNKNGAWIQSILHSFGYTDGANPSGNVIVSSNSIIGTTNQGGQGWGTVYQLQNTSNGWQETSLTSFQGFPGGMYPSGGLILSRGILFGTTSGGGQHDDGEVFQVIQ